MAEDSRVRAWVAAAGDLLLGAACHGCGRPWWGVCPDCRAGLASRQPAPTRPDPCPPGFPLTYAGGPYDGLAAGLITAYKDRQALTLGPMLGGCLAKSVEALLDARGVHATEEVVLVPVPSAHAAVRERGLDASLVIARYAARRLRRDGSRRVHAAALLRQARRLRDQAGLTAQQRRTNLAGALRATAHGRRSGALVIVVDDVVTTGASLTEAVRALTENPVTLVGAATVAATVRRHRPGAR